LISAIPLLIGRFGTRVGRWIGRSFQVAVRRQPHHRDGRTADLLGVQVRVWKSNHDPRNLITAGLTLDPPGQMGQDSHLDAASQNIHS
jgi:hypothetical protein